MRYKVFFGSLLNSLLCIQALAQTKNDITLKVGDRAPSLKVYKWIKGEPMASFETGRSYVIDFGATWCIPCAKAIPHLSNIASKYIGKTNVIGVFVMEAKKDSLDYSYVQNVKKYVQKQADNIKYTVAIDDAKATVENNWIKAAGLDGIPQTFLIDKKGLIAWIGSANSPSLDEEIRFVNSDDYSINEAIKRAETSKSLEPVTIDILKPFFLEGNGGDGGDFLFRSILTKYKGESGGDIGFVYSGKSSRIPSEMQPRPGMVQVIGASIEKLYYLAYADTLTYAMASRMISSNQYPDFKKYPMLKDGYGNFWYKAILDVSDQSPFKFDHRLTSNRYNYSLIVPDELATAKYLQQVMRKDLDSYFGYNVKVEERMMPYWRLIATPGAKERLKTKTPGEKYRVENLHDSAYKYSNSVMKDILIRFIFPFSYGQSLYGWVKPKEEAPFIDETGIFDEIDYDITQKEFDNFRNGDWESCLNYLHRLGLDLVKGERLTKVVIIRDPKSYK